MLLILLFDTARQLAIGAYFCAAPVEIFHLLEFDKAECCTFFGDAESALQFFKGM